MTTCFINRDKERFDSPKGPFVMNSDYAGIAFQEALREWRIVLGGQAVTTDQKALNDHGQNAYGSSTRGEAILRPINSAQVQEIVRVANRFKIPLYPVSAGKNWGYGAASPTVSGCAVVDLSEMRSIRIVDSELGIVSLQPGVTQGILADFLKHNRLDLMTPVHGGGPSCSLVGNALERGYGLTPNTDHFAALTSLSAVLPDGSLYQSPFHALGAETIGSLHRWGVGPYIEGLFSQGNFGIVTEATFTLQRRPEHVEAFFMRLPDDRSLGEIVDRLRVILASLGGTIVGVNMMNNRRVLAMSRPYPSSEVQPGQAISPELCKKMTQKAGISEWTVAGVIHCPYAMRRAVRQQLRRLLPRSTSRPIHMNRQRVQYARNVASWLPVGNSFVMKQMGTIDAFLDFAEGIPNNFALQLAYWLHEKAPSTERDHNPARDGCGLIWYSPLVPMKSREVQRYTEMAYRVCMSHGIEPLITLTTLSERLLDSTVPILFRPQEPGAADRAHACYEALLREGQSLGCMPYRLGTNQMQQFIQNGDSHWDFVQILKSAADPHNLISPGRYCPLAK